MWQASAHQKKKKQCWQASCGILLIERRRKKREEKRQVFVPQLLCSSLVVLMWLINIKWYFPRRGGEGNESYVEESNKTWSANLS